MGRLDAERDALPVELAGLGVFPGSPAAVWAAPVVTETLLARQAALATGVPDARCHGHCEHGRWAPHVRSGHAEAPGRAVEVPAPLWRGPLRGRLDQLELVRFRPVAVLRSAPSGRRAAGAHPR